MKHLRSGWELWKRIGQIIGDFVARIVLTIFYFTVFLPFGLGVRYFGDPLSIKRKSDEHWLKRELVNEDIESARRSA